MAATTDEQEESPTMSERYDLVAVGTGSAATSAALACNANGWDVAVVDRRLYGGTCALRGCDPKKVLVGAADALDWTRRMEGRGLSAEGLRIDWTDLVAFKRSFTRSVPEDRERTFREAGVDTLHGRARFTARDTLSVDGDAIEADHVLVASGAKPRPLDMPGEEHLTRSDEFLELDELPDRIAFVGGGYISFEFAHVAARAGADATILHRSERVLKAFEADLVDRLVEATREAGIRVRTNAPVTEVEETGEGLMVHTDDGVDAVPCDLAVHGAGRVPALEDLGLEAAGVERDRDGVVVDEHLRSPSNSRVYAAGDAAATPGWPLTPVAGAEGEVAAANMQGDEETVDYEGTASVVFTIPPMARVGLTEAEAREQDIDLEVREGDMSDWYSYERVAAEPAAYKVLVEEETDRIVGAHLLGERAEETINLFALAVRQGIPASELRELPWAYPTHASDVAYMV